MCVHRDFALLWRKMIQKQGNTSAQNVSAMQDIKENDITERETIGYFKTYHQDRLH